MSAFQVPIGIGDPTGQSWREVDAWVDTGSTYTWVPDAILRELGAAPNGRREFDTADGTVIERDIAETQIRLNGEVHTTVVVFADGGATLLGAVALETFGRAADPLHHRLVPVRALALTVHSIDLLVRGAGRVGEEEGCS